MAGAPTPFVIVADHRTGSTLLSTSLDCAPDLRCRGELFHERDFPDNQLVGADRHALSAADILARAFAAEAGERAVGFRAHIVHPPASRPAWADLWQRLAEVDGLRVVQLRRDDRLAQYASLLVASHTGVFHPSPDNPAPAQRPRVQVDGPSFLRWLAETDARRAACERALARHPALHLSYEQLCDDWDAAIAALQRFLGVPQRRLGQQKHKLETRPLAEVVVNCDEARRLLARYRGSRP